MVVLSCRTCKFIGVQTPGRPEPDNLSIERLQLPVAVSPRNRNFLPFPSRPISSRFSRFFIRALDSALNNRADYYAISRMITGKKIGHQSRGLIIKRMKRTEKTLHLHSGCCELAILRCFRTIKTQDEVLQFLRLRD